MNTDLMRKNIENDERRKTFLVPNGVHFAEITNIYPIPLNQIPQQRPVRYAAQRHPLVLLFHVLP